MKRILFLALLVAMLGAPLLGGCGRSNSAPVAQEPDAGQKLNREIQSVKDDPGLTDGEKSHAIAMLTGQKEADEKATIQQILNDPKLSEGQKKAQVDI